VIVMTAGNTKFRFAVSCILNMVQYIAGDVPKRGFCPKTRAFAQFSDFGAT
jgi:hypothetical protein